MSHVPVSLSSSGAAWRSWMKFALVSLIFFQITAATFTSLGVALPFMIEELAWSWSSAGLGFSVLSFMVGITGRVPSWTLRKFGTRATFGIGGAIMAAGFVLLALTTDLNHYLAGAALAGLGYTLCAIVPGVAVINQWLPHRRSFAIGAYMTIGGLGGVAGPLIVTSVVTSTQSWRMHWWLMAASIAVLAALAIFSLRSPADHHTDNSTSGVSAEKHSRNVHMTQLEWQFRDVLRTPQYYIIVAAMTITLFGGVTTNSWAVVHMGNLGVVFAIAAGALSAHALINSSSRAFGGILATWIDPKWLLVSALVAGNHRHAGAGISRQHDDDCPVRTRRGIRLRHVLVLDHDVVGELLRAQGSAENHGYDVSDYDGRNARPGVGRLRCRPSRRLR